MTPKIQYYPLQLAKVVDATMSKHQLTFVLDIIMKLKCKLTKNDLYKQCTITLVAQIHKLVANQTLCLLTIQKKNFNTNKNWFIFAYFCDTRAAVHAKNIGLSFRKLNFYSRLPTGCMA